MELNCRPVVPAMSRTVCPCAKATMTSLSARVSPRAGDIEHGMDSVGNGFTEGVITRAGKVGDGRSVRFRLAVTNWFQVLDATATCVLSVNR